MRSHLLSVAALALLSVFVVVSTPCLAEGEETGTSNVVDPTLLPPNSDPTQTTPPLPDGSDAAATVEEAVEPEEVPHTEE